jgi:putative ABC transport system permease protein
VIGIIREALLSAKSQPVASALTLLVVAGMVLTVMLTTGRTVGAEQRVLGTIDSAGTRSITIRAEPDAGLTSSVLARIAGIDGIEWAAGFSAASDATNSKVLDGQRVPVRRIFSAENAEHLGIPASPSASDGIVWASELALEQLGLPDRTGSITLTSGETIGVGGRMDVPDYLRGLEPLVLIDRRDSTGTEPIGVLIVVAESPDLVAPVSEAVVSMLAVDDASKITVQTSEALAQLRSVVEGQLGSFSRGLVLALLALSGLLVAVLLYGLVMMRRKDFGRRRALGASRSLIVTLLLTQTAVLAMTGIVVGVMVSTLILIFSGDPAPGFAFTVALAVLTLATALIASVIPAIIASRREPIRELRVP